MNICPAYLRLKVSNVNVVNTGTSKFYVILLLIFLLKYLFHYDYHCFWFGYV